MIIPKSNGRGCYGNRIRHNPLSKINKGLTHIRGIGHPHAVDPLTAVQETSNQLSATFSYTGKTLRRLLRIEPGELLLVASRRVLAPPQPNRLSVGNFIAQ